MSKAMFLRHALILCSAFFICALYSCKTRKAAQPAKAIVDIKPMKGDSVESLLDKIQQYSFKAEWMSAKASVTANDSGQETSFDITLRIHKDSIIWISVSPLLGIEVARIMITPDSIKMLDRLHGQYQCSSFEYINKLLQMKVNFEIVQALLTGNFFAYKRNENKFNSVYLEDDSYILSSLTNHILKRSLEDKDPNHAVIQDRYISPYILILITTSVEDQIIQQTFMRH